MLFIIQCAPIKALLVYFNNTCFVDNDGRISKDDFVMIAFVVFFNYFICNDHYDKDSLVVWI